jgi:hypothetical protein
MGSGDVRHEVVRQRRLGSSIGLLRQGVPGDGPGFNASNVGVHHGGGDAEGEAGHGRRRVLPDPGQGPELLVVGGDLSAMDFDDLAGAGVQPQRAARVSES